MRKKKKKNNLVPMEERLKEGTLVYCRGRWSWGIEYSGRGIVISDNGTQGVKLLFTDDTTGETRVTGIFRPHMYEIVEKGE